MFYFLNPLFWILLVKKCNQTIFFSTSIKMNWSHIKKCFRFSINKIQDLLIPAQFHFSLEAWVIVQQSHNLKKFFKDLIQINKAQSHLQMLLQFWQKEINKATLKINFCKHLKVYKTRLGEEEILTLIRCLFMASKNIWLILDKHWPILNFNNSWNFLKKIT